MPPLKASRGQATLDRLKALDGILPPYDKKLRVVALAAFKVVRLKTARKFAYLGLLAHEVGWTYRAVTATLEKRKETTRIHDWKKKQLMKPQKQAEKSLEKKNRQIPRGFQDPWTPGVSPIKMTAYASKNKNKKPSSRMHPPYLP